VHNVRAGIKCKDQCVWGKNVLTALLRAGKKYTRNARAIGAPGMAESESEIAGADKRTD